jgi:hypothetical protein
MIYSRSQNLKVQSKPSQGKFASYPIATLGRSICLWLLCELLLDAAARMVNIVLIIVGAIVPFVLLFMNFILLARYIDPAHAKGHWISKGIIVRQVDILKLSRKLPYLLYSYSPLHWLNAAC